MGLHCLILAAGAGSRFGGLKPLAEIDGESLLLRTIRLAESVALNPVQVIIGCEADLLRAHLQEAPVEIVEHRQWRDGIGSSIAAGVKVLPDSASAVMILLCDQASVTNADLIELRQAYETTTGDRIVCSGYNQCVGVPAIFPQSYFVQLKKLSGDSGAKKIINNNSPLVVAMPSAEWDVDRREDLQKFTTIK